MQFELNDEELTVLEEVLERALRGLREEIYKAEVADYKSGLKRRERLILGLLDRVQARPTAG
jgi:hypothetical protein